VNMIWEDLSRSWIDAWHVPVDIWVVSGMSACSQGKKSQCQYCNNCSHL
jgi:hypothetical protein